jgi:dephospho-CoA kinase
MIIGLTGRIGVGKSTASQIIKKKYNFYIIDLDVIGHGILRQEK